MTCDGNHGGYAPCDDPQCWHRNPAREPVGSILDEAERLTSTDRQRAYGHPLDDYSCTAAVWTAMLKHAGLIPKDIGYQIPPELAQAMMIALKLVRLSQNLEHRDSLVDIAGYARTIEMTIEERSQRWADAEARTRRSADNYLLNQRASDRQTHCDGTHSGAPCADPECHVWKWTETHITACRNVNPVNDATSEAGASGQQACGGPRAQ